MAVVDSPRINRTEVLTNTLNEISRGVSDMEGVKRVLNVAKDLGRTEGYGIVKSLESAIRPLPIATEALPLTVNMRKEIVTDVLLNVRQYLHDQGYETGASHLDEGNPITSPLKIEGYHPSGHSVEMVIQSTDKGTNVVFRQLNSTESQNNRELDQDSMKIFNMVFKLANAIDPEVQTLLIHNGLVCADIQRYGGNSPRNGPVPFNPKILVGMVALPIPGNSGEKEQETFVTDWNTYFRRYGVQADITWRPSRSVSKPTGAIAR